MTKEDIEQAIYERTQEFVPQCVYEAILELIASEREACAKVCEELRHDNYSQETSEWISGTTYCANAIRARGQA